MAVILQSRHARFTVRSTSLLPRVLLLMRGLDAVIERRDCGTGAGGFKPGNKCAGGDGAGGGDSSGAFSASGGRSKELTAEIKDGDEVTVPDEIDKQHIDSFNWDAAERHAADGGEGAKEIVDYTMNQLKFNNYFRYGERLLLPQDATIEQQRDAWRQKWPDGHGKYIPVWDEAGHGLISKTAEDYENWSEALARADDVLDRVSKSSGKKIALDPTKEYTHDPAKANKNTVFVPGITELDAWHLTGGAGSIDYHRERHPGAKEPKDLLPKLDDAISKHTDAKEYPRDGTGNYLNYLSPRGQILYQLNGGETISTVSKGAAMAAENAIKEVAAKSNPRGDRLVTWRGIRLPEDSLVDDDNDERAYVSSLKNAQPGQILKEAGIFSSSASPAAAAGFTSDNGVLLRVVGKSGAPLEKISANKNEHEVAYPDSAQFKVRRVARKVTVKAGKWHRKNVTVIDIEEA